MGIFDFLKLQKKRSAIPENIDEIFDLASKDIAYRPLFYRTILEMELYLLTSSDRYLMRGTFISDQNTELQIKIFEDGKVPVFTAIDKIFENGIVKGPQNYIAMNGRTIFEMFTYPTTFLINPYSRPSKEILPDEITKLLNGEYYRTNEERTSKAGLTIQIGIPFNYPRAMVETLRKYCDTREEIQEVYLALMHDNSSGEVPHLLIGLYATGDLVQIFGEVMETIRIHIPIGEPVDMINISDNGMTANVLKQKQFQIY